MLKHYGEIKSASTEFQVFVKPIGSSCNLGCQYCYYLEKEHLYPGRKSLRMPDHVLEEYIIQHIEASSDPVINFSWHGGEPTLVGLDYFRKIVELQHKHLPTNQKILNGIQTNGTLLDDAWCRFFKDEGFVVGISIDGPEDMHNRYRTTKNKKSSFKKTMRGYELLQKYRVSTEILCVVNAYNVNHPLEIYRFFRDLGTQYMTFLPLVERLPGSPGKIDENSVPPELYGILLCKIFDEWQAKDIGKVKVQIFEEAARTAFGQEHTLCVFKKTCGGVPVIEHNGDFYSCDHYVNAEYHLGNILETHLFDLLESSAQRAFGQAKLDTLPHYCQVCEVREMCNGGCPKNRFIHTPDGEPGLNYLCPGYKHFFNHCKPFVDEVASLWRQQNMGQQINANEHKESVRTSKPGRNDPCPCGSGKKYKNCCMNN